MFFTQRFVIYHKEIDYYDMLANTGTISFLLYGIFILITVVALIIAYYQIKKGEIPAEKLDKMIELFKYAIVTTAISTVTLVVADLFKEREQDIKELEYFDKYVEDVKKVDGIRERLQLSKYLSIVAPSGEMKKSWEKYYEIVKEEYEEYLDLKSEVRNIDTLSNPTKDQLKQSEAAREAIYMFEKPISKGATDRGRPTIYIQYCDKEIKQAVSEVQQLFNTNLWNAPGVEYVARGCDNSIRYFHDEDRSLASEANTLLGNTFTIKRSSLRAPKGQIELWVQQVNQAERPNPGPVN